MKRIKANDPVALKQMCVKLHDEGDYEGAFEYLERAAALEDMEGRTCICDECYQGEVSCYYSLGTMST